MGMPKPLIRYSFANSKQIHMDVYRNTMSDLISTHPGMHPEEIAAKALRLADAAVDTLYEEGMIFREKTPPASVEG